MQTPLIVLSVTLVIGFAFFVFYLYKKVKKQMEENKEKEDEEFLKQFMKEEE